MLRDLSMWLNAFWYQFQHGEGVSYPTSNFLDTSRMSSVQLNSDTNQRQFPQVNSSVPKECPPPPFQMVVASQGFTCASDRPTRLEAPMTFFLGLNDLQVQLTELRETFYLLDFLFIIKGYN